MTFKKVNYQYFERVAEYGLYIFVFLLPLQTRWMAVLGKLNDGYWEYGTISLYATDILLIVLLFCCFFVLSRKDCRISRIWWLVGILKLAVFISIFFAFDWKLALYGWGRFLLGIGLFFLLTHIKYDRVKLYWSLIFAGVAQSLLALQQFFTQNVFASKWLGVASQRASDLGVSVVAAGSERFLRTYGSLPHPNILGGFLAIVLLVNIILYFELHNRDKYLVSGIKYKASLLLCLVIFVINFVGLLLTFSRAAALGFLAGFIVLLLHCFIVSRSKEAIFALAKFVIIIAIAGGIFVGLFKGPVAGRLNANSRLEAKSITERTAYTQEAWQIIKNHRLFGAGVKNYGLAVYNEIDGTLSAYEYQPVHNVFLLVWAEIGVVGFLLFIAPLLHCYIANWRRRNLETLALLVALIVLMCFDHWLWSLAFGVYLFWGVIGLSIKRLC
ncbi:MAG: O-antigen ligase family protein [Patescibacteria group bacterium]|jgi:O-antigen ligase